MTEPFEPVIIITKDDLNIDNCAFCHTNVDPTLPVGHPDEVIKCKSCETYHHKRCWEDNGSYCAQSFCGSNEYKTVSSSNEINVPKPIVISWFDLATHSLLDKLVNIGVQLRTQNQKFINRAFDWVKKNLK